MKWLEPLYISESMQKKEKRIKWKLKHNAGVLIGYVITISSNPENLLDIYPTKYLKQNGFWKDSMEIVGIAKTYDEALELVTQIVDEVYKSTNGTAVKEYLYNRKEL